MFQEATIWMTQKGELEQDKQKERLKGMCSVSAELLVKAPAGAYMSPADGGNMR